MAKFNLNPNPTFKAKVEIHVPGGRPGIVEFTFRYRSKSAFKEWLASLEGKDDPDSVMEAATGWDLDDPFDREKVAELCDRYMTSAQSILNKYIEELSTARLGN